MLNRRTLAGALQCLEGHAARLWERPLLCLAAGAAGRQRRQRGGSSSRAVGRRRAGGDGVGPAARWSCAAMRRCCRAAFLGLLLTCLHLGWQGLPLPPEHVSYRLPAPPRTLARRRASLTGPWNRAVTVNSCICACSGCSAGGSRGRRPAGSSASTCMPTACRICPATSSGWSGCGCIVRVPQAIRAPSTFAARWQRRGIHAVGGVTNPERLRLLRRADGFGLARTLEGWRRSLRAEVSRHLPAPYDAVFLAIVLGHKGSLPEDIQTDFRTRRGGAPAGGVGVARRLHRRGYAVRLAAVVAHDTQPPAARPVARLAPDAPGRHAQPAAGAAVLFPGRLARAHPARRADDRQFPAGGVHRTAQRRPLRPSRWRRCSLCSSTPGPSPTWASGCPLPR